MSAPPPVPSDDRARAARETMDALARSHDVFEDFFVSARIGLALADLDGRYVRANETYAQLLGRLPEDLVGVPVSEVLDDSASRDLFALLAGEQHAVHSEQSFLHPNGMRTWLLHGVAPVEGPDGRAAWFAVSAQDITERRRAEQELRDLTAVLSAQAAHDPLTGLANRGLFEERLQAALARDARSGGATGVLFLDLDGFKVVNDGYGHAFGDAVLQATADRLRRTVRPSDTLARLGGDEFVVLVDTATEAGLHALTMRLHAAVTAPMTVQGRSVQVGLSIGAALARAGDADPSGLVAEADARMYEAKRRGGGVTSGLSDFPPDTPQERLTRRPGSP